MLTFSFQPTIMQYFKVYTKADVLAHTQIRRFETKLGECVQVLNDPQHIEASIAASNALFVLIGVPEDIGVRGNYGIGGADTVWVPFLKSFLNIQSNDFFGGDNVLVAGHFDFSDFNSVIEVNAKTVEEKIEAYRHAVHTIDEALEPMIKLICQYKKIPIIIGGGHNNAYPCIKGAAKGLHKAGVIPLAQINAINLDAHADYRPAEGRHSGNPFRYADDDGYLQKYCVVGLHENYIPQNSWLDIVNNPFFDCITFEDIFLHGKRSFIQAVEHAVGFTSDTYCGIELDADSIQNTLSSAVSPVGVLPNHARQYIHYAASTAKVAYLHIAEAAAQLVDSRRNDSMGKLLSYFVSDFVKAFGK